MRGVPTCPITVLNPNKDCDVRELDAERVRRRREVRSFVSLPRDLVTLTSSGR